ncbi:type I-B CRISPR-associated endonuclease Cas1b [Peptoniphilus sp. MSJ-1]|uniref:CRISPR-associated endonuclease Cas1 n=1 Tax=Peptoniphilus ovalis TaxID=2841503 RepID=A0ABS6FE30_9FIRM|nr:type I-B CRISPR-associated endonuclease Cas1b [Peptoniphilus ovalis]MBU5668425.1 type I-B CRISPR-associated endonuclease Cas1b [Peptoniphilus ovalis]
MGKTKYILSDGELKRKDNSLCFRKDGKNNYIPIENINEIYLLNETSINTKLLDFLSQHKIVLHFFNYYGNYSGSYYPREAYISGRLLIAQVDAYKYRRMEIARAIVRGILENIHEVLYHYYKHDKKEVKPYLDYIKNELSIKIENSTNIKELLSYEGELWQGLYYNFRYFLEEDFIINKRVKRPPDNPINALISFGNSLLYTKTIAAIYKTHLNQSISYLHEPSESRFSLSLDMCEVFKPIIVFKTIFELVNNKKIKVEKHFVRELNYCILNEEGKKIFIQAFEDRIESKIRNEKLKRHVSYRTQIKLDCYKLIKYILEDKKFEPFNLGRKY